MPMKRVLWPHHQDPSWRAMLVTALLAQRFANVVDTRLAYRAETNLVSQVDC